MLELKDIVKIYDMGENKVEALKGINLNFRDSEFVSILGASGCGKTTLLNIVGGLDKYTSGDLVIDGKSTKQFRDSDWDTYRNHKIGFVFQSYNLIQHLNVLENVEIALSLTGISKKERREKAVDALTKVGLLDQINKMPNQLSGGQMQRVAIARAIVNNPSIILADEPTGALDTNTSKQIMEILKEISKDKLIIMVTHNPKLANKYSTRIIKLLDGKVSGDNQPFELNCNENNEENYRDIDVKSIDKNAKNNSCINDFVNKDNQLQNYEILKNNNKNTENEQKNNQFLQKNNKKQKKSSLNFWTALFLSLKNLLTKKGRTFLTSFAGSIGIIGVALVLSISNGFTLYINNLQRETLGGYPVSVSTATVDFKSLDFNEMMTGDDGEVLDDVVYVTGDQSEYIKYGHYNCINQNFLNYVKDFERDYFTNNPNTNFSLIEYNYYAPTKFLVGKYDGTAKLVKTKNSISLLSGSSSQVFYPEFSQMDFVYKSYDVVYTAPDYDETDEFGLTLVLAKGNKLTKTIFDNLGLQLTRDAETGKFLPISFEDICENTKIQLLYNNDFYVYDAENDVFNTIDTSNEALKTLFDSNILQNLKITKIIAPKKDSSISLLSDGIMYSYKLHQNYLQNCATSQIVQKQMERRQIEEGSGNYNFYVKLEIEVSELKSIMSSFDLNSTTSIEQFLQVFFKSSITLDEAYQMGLQQIGASSIPQSIVFYPKNFDAKKQVSKMIDDYNKTVEKPYDIVYTDSSEFLTSTLGTMIDVISIVLIAFAGISLVVSSIMIGIITYVSVIERTKEIGILRSLGARKQDISRIFNAETLIIGALAGLIGVLVTYMFCPIINVIVGGLSGVQGIANFSPVHALSLIAISMILTLISGSIPSRIASKKDPVECLRTEWI